MAPLAKGRGKGKGLPEIAEGVKGNDMGKGLGAVSAACKQSLSVHSPPGLAQRESGGSPVPNN